MVQRPLVGQGLHIIEASRSHSGAPHSVGLLWTSDRPVADTLPTTHNPHMIQTSMLWRDLNPKSQKKERPRIHALDRGPTGTSILLIYRQINFYAKINDKFSYILYNILIVSQYLRIWQGLRSSSSHPTNLACITLQNLLLSEMLFTDIYII